MDTVGKTILSNEFYFSAQYNLPSFFYDNPMYVKMPGAPTGNAQAQYAFLFRAPFIPSKFLLHHYFAKIVHHSKMRTFINAKCKYETRGSSIHYPASRGPSI